MKLTEDDFGYFGAERLGIYIVYIINGVAQLRWDLYL